jgi:endoglucanase
MPEIRADQIRLLERLCNASAVSGDEGEVRAIVVEELTGHADELRVDALGNVLAVRHGRRRGAPRVMLAAHMDEVGFMIVADNGDGIFQFATVGGIRPQLLLGKAVVVGRDHRPGVIGAAPVHLAKGNTSGEPDAQALRIDLGGEGRAAIGERAVFATRFQRSGKAILAKAIDDRIGVATVLELIRTAPANVELHAAFTVQEEIGSYGAGVAAHAIDPVLAIVIESTAALDLPGSDSGDAGGNTRLGGGPAIYVADSATVYDQRLVEWLEKAAKRGRVAYQVRQPGRGGTDGRSIQQARNGVPTVAVAVPHRYTHSPVSIARLEDWASTLKLLQVSLRGVSPGFVRSLRARPGRAAARTPRGTRRATRR